MGVKEFCEKYYTDRKGTNSLKWDALDVRFGDPDLIAMWVADMEFRTPECAVEALHKRVDHGIFGYSFVPDSYYEAVIDWEYKHHGYKVEKDWIRISPGVVSAFYWGVNMYTQPGDAIVIVTPVYYPFHNAIKDSGRKLIPVDMDYDKGVFNFNAERFEKAIVENNVKLYLMCSPQNPSNRVWTEEELDSMLAICEKHNVLVIADEIHQDMVFGGHKFIPAATVSGGKYADRIVTLFASSKTFNLATCLTSTVVISNPELREIWDKFVNIYHQVEVNIFGITAVEAVLRGGEEWYEGVKEVIVHNYKLLKEGLKEFEDLYIAPFEGSYLAFLDLRKYVPLDEVHSFTQDKCRLAVDYGEWFGENWAGFIRLNLATHPDIVQKAVDNIRTNLRAYVK